MENAIWNGITIIASDISKDYEGYATALEAVIGFLFLKYPEKVFGILKKQFSDEIILNNRK